MMTAEPRRPSWAEGEVGGQGPSLPDGEEEQDWHEGLPSLVEDTTLLMSGNEDKAAARGRGVAPPEAMGGGFRGMPSLGLFRPYFDLDTETVKERLKSAMTPWRGLRTGAAAGGGDEETGSGDALLQPCTEAGGSSASGGDKARGKSLLAVPDLYGPFWVLNTFIFTLSVGANLHRTYDFRLVVTALCTVYGASVVASVSMFAMLPLSLPQTLCITGYSHTAYVPFSVLCALPLPFIEYLALPLAAGWASMFLLRQMQTAVTEDMRTKAMGIVVVSEVTFMVVLIWFFYSY